MNNYFDIIKPIIADIKSHILSNIESFKEGIEKEFKYSFTIQTVIGNLNLIIINKLIGRGDYLAAYYPDSKTIKLTIYNKITKIDYQSIENLFKNEDFIDNLYHEITHFIDFNKYKQMDDKKDYYNSSIEVTAYLTTALNKSKEELNKGLTPKEYINKVLNTYFVSHGNKIIDKLTPENKRLVIRKITKFYIKNRNNNLLSEKLALKNYNTYYDLVAKAYDAADSFDASAVKYWNALNKSNYEWFSKISKQCNLIFVTDNKNLHGKNIEIQGNKYRLEYFEGGQPYETQPQMRDDFIKNRRLFISIDYSNHPLFSLIDNIVFRFVHDFLIHIKGNHPFGKGEINSYNLHARLAPEEALPALFTEVVGQASYALARGSFPEQKIAILKGFDYKNVGKIDNIEIVNKELKISD